MFKSILNLKKVLLFSCSDVCLLLSLMSDWMQVQKETWVPLELQDLLENQEAQEGLVLPDLKVFTETHAHTHTHTHTPHVSLNSCILTSHADIPSYV